MFYNGNVTKESDPRSVYESDPVFFMNCHLDHFRTKLNNLKKRYCDIQGSRIYIFMRVLSYKHALGDSDGDLAMLDVTTKKSTPGYRKRMHKRIKLFHGLEGG